MDSISPTEKVLVELREHIAVITINNPPANTWDVESLSGLKTIINNLNALPQISALVIHGQGQKFFSAGADLKQFAEGDKVLSAEVARLFGEAFETLAEFQGVSIAAVNGYAMGGGLECALACDIRIFEEHAQVALPEAKVGLLPCAGGTQRLGWLVGEAWAARLILCGERIDAATAEKIGLTQQAVSSGQALETALVLAQGVAQQSPDAVKACKRLLSQARENALAAGLKSERTNFVDLIGGANQREGTLAFLEKRKPDWKQG
ncbi:enoyl-CoA hydratase [Biformimicrobium ophioploci]|uniref:Enoyl-CoA hydratase n=1 Tax=Biformimicrobium ophioploci TaxID=3036711 RepID=A0ABQ6M264_9GAMM|nr:enoyl-CoA hydratase [Microbulbifer sp. NKW57]GMG88357.1 enoyl-CoA hydratase [Microbulbifer sp. NKW57]